LRIAALLGVVVLVDIVPTDAHEFTDKSGKLKVEGTLVAIDDMARNSDVASQMALAQNPGFSVGPARRLNGRFRW
jgi:hypothetical protein